MRELTDSQRMIHAGRCCHGTWPWRCNAWTWACTQYWSQYSYSYRTMPVTIRGRVCLARLACLGLAGLGLGQARSRRKARRERTGGNWHKLHRLMCLICLAVGSLWRERSSPFGRTSRASVRIPFVIHTGYVQVRLVAPILDISTFSCPTPLHTIPDGPAPAVPRSLSALRG